MQVFEIADQEWFPQSLRSYMQAALTAAWTTHIPLLQSSSPARIVAHLLSHHFGPSIHNYTFIDFCAGGGGPTPSIEKHLNASITTTTTTKTPSYAEAATAPPPVQFILTDLHPHTNLWSAAAAASPNVSFIPTSVDATNVPQHIIQDQKRNGKKVFRLFNLAFHHFDDNLARKILKNTLETSDGFGIFELQDRSPAGFLACCLFGLGAMVMAPYYAWLWGAPLALVWTYLVPALPAVLVFDGWMSSLRTRTVGEVKELMGSCGVDAKEVRGWEVKSGRERFIPGVGYVNWIIVTRKGSQE
ncbi:hypothetical protein QBC41DRAFT_226211 [Cercophora samala]|uniref:Uncharacterized protein n=1 Tax=Cercophora samala TaxID=330535 RepID=A0AA40DC22_9PEZI|nr:hypothetical protein QBC41DRAFT_226211 [Cercophora samala]